MDYYRINDVCALLTAILNVMGSAYLLDNSNLTAFVNSVYHTSFCPVIGSNYKYYHDTLPEQGSPIAEDVDGVIFSKTYRGKLKAVYVYKTNLKTK